MTLRKKLASWDGKSAEDIGNIYNCHAEDSEFLSQVIGYSSTPSLQKGATWLLKKHLESTGGEDANETLGILELLPSLNEWESKLHLLQCLQYLKIPPKHKTAVEQFAKSCIEGNNKFVRAWGYSGFYELACQYPVYQKEALQFLKMALHDEPASVKARVRKVMAKGF